MSRGSAPRAHTAIAIVPRGRTRQWLPKHVWFVTLENWLLVPLTRPTEENGYGAQVLLTFRAHPHEGPATGCEARAESWHWGLLERDGLIRHESPGWGEGWRDDLVALGRTRKCGRCSSLICPLCPLGGTPMTCLGRPNLDDLRRTL